MKGMLLRGDRASCYDYDGKYIGKGTVTWVGPIYMRVMMDGTERKMAFRVDRVRRLVPKKQPQ